MCCTRVYGFELMMSRLCCVRTGIAYSGNVDNSVAPPTATTLKQCGNDRKLGTHSDVSCSTDVTMDKTRVWFNQFSSKKMTHLLKHLTIILLYHLSYNTGIGWASRFYSTIHVHLLGESPRRGARWRSRIADEEVVCEGHDDGRGPSRGRSSI